MILDVSAHSLVHKNEIQTYTYVVAISYQALDPTSKNSQVFTEGTVIVPAHRRYLNQYELTKQQINQSINCPPNHAFAQLLQPWCVGYVQS